MQINMVTLDDNLSVSYELINVKKTDGKGQKSESIQAVARIVRDGEEIHKIYNIGNFDYCAKLLDRDFAIAEGKRMIENANRSAHSPFLRG